MGVPLMSALVTPFEPGAALARIASTPTGYRIDTRGPLCARAYDFASAGDTAEFAVLLRDEGRWPLRYGPGVEAVRAIVEEIDAEERP